METALTIVGLIIAAYGVYYSAKQFMKTRIASSLLEIYNFEKENYEKFKDLKIYLNDVEISNKLTFIKGIIFLVGHKDIDEESISRPISVKGNDDSKFRDFKIIRSSGNFEPEILNNEVLIKSEILKVNDFLLFELVCENLKSPVKIDHRILDTSSSIKIDYSRLQTIKSSIAFFVFFGIIMSAITYWSQSTLISKYKFDPIFFLHDYEISITSLEDQERLYMDGYNLGISTAGELITPISKDSIYKNSTKIASLPKHLEDLKFKKDLITHSKFEYENKANALLDSLMKGENKILFIISGNYRKKIAINKDISVSFVLSRYFDLIFTFCLMVLSLYYIIRASYLIVYYYKFLHPLQNLLKRENL